MRTARHGGDTIAGIFDKALWNKISPGAFFAIQTAIMAATAALFYLVARRFEQPEPRPDAPVTA